MNFKGSENMEISTEKHRNRFKNFIAYDLEGREIEEQIEILKAIIEVSKDLLNHIESKGENK